MRRSHKGLNARYIKKDDYPGLPKDLCEFNYYYADCGHVVMAIPKCLLEDAKKNGDLDMFECPVPCRYILTHGYDVYKDHIIVDIPYGEMGLEFDWSYIEL